MDIGGAISGLPWSSIAGLVAPYAPKIATVLGTTLGGLAGPLGAAVGGGIGGIAGRAIAAKFGLPAGASPQDVAAAINEDPKSGDKLAQLEDQEGDRIVADAQVAIERIKAETEQFRIAAEQGTAQQANVTDLMRAELQARVARNSDSFFHNGWRPASGWALVYGFVALLAGFTIAFIWYLFTGDKYPLDTLNANLFNFVMLLSSIAAVNGVTSWGKSYERGKAMEVATPEAQTTVVAAPPVAANTNVASTPDIGDIVGKAIKAGLGRKR